MRRQGSDTRYNVKRCRCEIANGQGERFPLRSGMLSDWVKQAIGFADITQAALGRHLTKRLGREIDRSAVNKMTKGKRQVAADELLEISKITGLPPPPDLSAASPPSFADGLDMSSPGIRRTQGPAEIHLVRFGEFVLKKIRDRAAVVRRAPDERIHLLAEELAKEFSGSEGVEHQLSIMELDQTPSQSEDRKARKEGEPEKVGDQA